MPGLMDMVYTLATNAGGLAIASIGRSLSSPAPMENRQPPSFFLPQRTLPKFSPPGLPQLPKMPELPRFKAIVPQSLPEATKAPTVAESYAAEMEDTAVACIPCTRRHVSTMATAGQEAAGTTSDYAVRKEIATVAAEALVMLEYDWTPDKLAKARPNDRQIIQSIQPDVQRLLSYMPMAPVHMLKAWAATDESRRFARSRQPSEKDHAEIARRVSDMEGWVGYTESTMSGSSDALTLIREARHAIVKQGHDLKTLDYAEEKLKEATVQLTPMPDPETVQRIARDTAAIKDKFYGQVLGNMKDRRQQAAPRFGFLAPNPLGDGKDWHMDKDTRLPAELRRFLEQKDTALPQELQTEFMGQQEASSNLPFGGLMGASRQIDTYMRNVLAFDRSQGITVRERSLPSTWESVLMGAYNPDDNVILLSTAVSAEDPAAFRTTVHESTHGILHNPHCLPNPTPPDVYQAEYEDTIEEQEADITTLVIFTNLGLPLEVSDGTTVPARQWQVNDTQLRAALDSIMYQRVTWAGKVLTAAAQGKTIGGSCPVRR